MSLRLLFIEDRSFCPTELLSNSIIGRLFHVEILRKNESLDEKLLGQKFDWIFFTENYKKGEDSLLAQELIESKHTSNVAIIKANLHRDTTYESNKIHFIICSQSNTAELAEKLLNLIASRKLNAYFPHDQSILPEGKYFLGLSNISRIFLRDLYQAINYQKNIFIVAPKGAEIQLLSREISSWLGSPDGFDYISFNYLTSPSLRSLINDAENTANMRNLIVVRNLHHAMDRQKDNLIERIKNEDTYNKPLRVLFWIEESLMDDGYDVFTPELFSIIQSKALFLPKLQDRPLDIAEYVKRIATALVSDSVPLTWSPEAISILLQYRWPENYLELAYFMSYILKESNVTHVTAKMLNEYFKHHNKNSYLPQKVGQSLESVIESRRIDFFENKFGDNFDDLADYLKVIKN